MSETCIANLRAVEIRVYRVSGRASKPRAAWIRGGSVVVRDIGFRVELEPKQEPTHHEQHEAFHDRSPKAMFRTLVLSRVVVLLLYQCRDS